jgi:hypothetical protein
VGNDLGFSEAEDHGTGEEVPVQQGEEGPMTKKPHVEDEEEELLTILKRFRNNWLETMSPFVGPLKATSKLVLVFRTSDLLTKFHMKLE